MKYKVLAYISAVKQILGALMVLLVMLFTLLSYACLGKWVFESLF